MPLPPVSALPTIVNGLAQFHDTLSAYNICLSLETDIQIDIESKRLIGARDMIYCRILGYLLRYAPSERARLAVVSEINSCGNERSKILAVGQLYFDHYIRAFRANKGRTPTSPGYVSQPSFAILSEMIRATLVKIPENYSEAKANKGSCSGDFRCSVSQKIDRTSMYNLKSDELSQMARNSGTTVTQCVHIFAELSSANSCPDSSKATTMWDVMRGFGYEQLPEELSGLLVHRLENVLTLAQDPHDLFDRMSLWFVATGEPNTYTLEARYDFEISEYPKTVTFASRTIPNGQTLPAPSPTYLAIHAACAKVAHLSGAAEYIDRLEFDAEDSRHLEENGVSAELLEHAIFNLHVSGARRESDAEP